MDASHVTIGEEPVDAVFHLPRANKQGIDHHAVLRESPQRQMPPIEYGRQAIDIRFALLGKLTNEYSMGGAIGIIHRMADKVEQEHALAPVGIAQANPARKPPIRVSD
ncbi:hypothetical protein SAMN06295987_1011002 [Novosphingobium mathurense]|uniref:Uncharacterized protein n=1 Tax=Novosphingobium mathurense TaxID=428990 RepID=A0A1U6H101_9SPHN|nr:hypothetical protein SAMN06295987_1011002 [Novosphingobium mathurense]